MMGIKWIHDGDKMNIVMVFTPFKFSLSGHYAERIFNKIEKKSYN